MKVCVRILASWTLAVGVCGGAWAAAADGPVVTTGAGAVRGLVESGVAVFKGVPYAAAPVGDLRWRWPRPAPAWSGTREATGYGASCLQPQRQDRPTEVGSTDEDCLTLNVWSPDVSGRAPVLVWIHGGAFRIGSGSVPFYDGGGFAKNGVVLVTLNYRLGRFGFFAHPALGDEAGNFGLADQIAALEWVRDHIAAFGGDPRRVTLFGESAGGASVLHLLTSPAAAGLFAGAIIESGGGHQRNRWLDAHTDMGAHTNVGARTGLRESLLEEGLAWARSVGVADDDVAALRGLPAATVLGSGRIEGGMGSVAPVTDGARVPADPGVRLARGEFNRVPVLVGANSYEASVLAAFGTTSEAVVANAGVDPARIAEVYGAAAGPDLAHTLFGDATFVAGARHVARTVAAAGEPAWLYHFDYVLKRRRGKVPGAGHGSEIPFVFDTLGRLPFAAALVAAEDQAMADTMHRYWVNFALKGDPNGSGLPRWPAVTKSAERTLLLGEKIEAVKDFRAAQLDFHQKRWEAAVGL